MCRKMPGIAIGRLCEKCACARDALVETRDARVETRDVARATPTETPTKTTTDEDDATRTQTQATVNVWCVIRTCVRRRSCACATSVITERIRDGASYAAASA